MNKQIIYVLPKQKGAEPAKVKGTIDSGGVVKGTINGQSFSFDTSSQGYQDQQFHQIYVGKKFDAISVEPLQFACLIEEPIRDNLKVVKQS